MEKKFFTTLRVAFPVASVWFGAVVGPSMVSGAFAIVYFAPYGAWGVIFPMLAMAIAAVVIGMGANIYIQKSSMDVLRKYYPLYWKSICLLQCV